MPDAGLSALHALTPLFLLTILPLTDEEQAQRGSQLVARHTASMWQWWESWGRWVPEIIP